MESKDKRPLRALAWIAFAAKAYGKADWGMKSDVVAGDADKMLAEFDARFDAAGIEVEGKLSPVAIDPIEGIRCTCNPGVRLDPNCPMHNISAPEPLEYPAGAVKLATDLCDVLMEVVGDTGKSEGAVEVARRLVDEHKAKRSAPSDTDRILEGMIWMLTGIVNSMRHDDWSQFMIEAAEGIRALKGGGA